MIDAKKDEMHVLLYFEKTNKTILFISFAKYLRHAMAMAPAIRISFPKRYEISDKIRVMNIGELTHYCKENDIELYTEKSKHNINRWVLDDSMPAL